VATSIVFNRVSDKGLPDSGPQQDLKDCNVHQLVDINPLELDAIRDRYRILVARLLFEHFPCFAMFKPYVSESTDCSYAEEMAKKSEVITMPVVMKDEKKYAEVVDVLDQLEKLLET
jgi:glutaredoxin